MPIRTRLTIWYTAVLALVLLIFGTGVYIYVSWQMIQQVDSRLSQAANTALPLALSQRPEVEERAGHRVLTLPGLDALRASETYVQLIGPRGQVIGISPNVADPFLTNHLDPKAFKEAIGMPAEQRANLFTEAQHRGLPPIRVFTQALTARNGEVVGYLQVATSLESVKAAQNSLLIALLSLGGLGILFSAVIGALLARRALRPVDELTKTAMAIYRAENLDQRVAVPKTNDEVSRLSQAFNEMLDRLSKLFHAQQRLIADVSHEMRTPLTVIRGNVDLLRAMGCADEESLDALTRESDRMTRLVGDLLLLSQADAGVLPMHFHTVRLSQVISDVERSGQVLSAGRVNVSAHVEPDLVIQADADRLKQVLLNLVDNAIKHTPEGGQVRIEAVRSYNNYVRISVSDTGIGIPEKDLPHVFERFYRVDKSRSRANGGSGLGLAIAHSIVQAHNGRIVVNSKLGVGTTFDVYLPRQHQPASSGESEAISA
ncbi:MAG: ATP-binding protein [Thermoflexales bacterium]|nr:ATP-binding protein [Thermoflexales bacterium]MDW8350932.1 ATP-binding protein [Anaerolineae bacterium]